MRSFEIAKAAFVAAMACVLSAHAAKPQVQEPVSGTLSIEATPASAKVFIDRRDMGNAPLSAQLPPGDHFVEVTSDGFTPDRATVRIVENETYSHSVVLRQTTGIALLTSDPPGAEVTIGGVSYGKTPCLVSDLVLGTYQATLFLGGYRETKVQFVLADRVPVKASASLVSDTATLDVTCNVDDAEIKVNGIIRGTAPCLVERIPAGDVIIEATCPGYKPYTQMTKLGEAEVLKVDIKLEVQPAVLKVVSIPDKARVYFDNEFKGETPFTLEGVAPGEHRVRVEKTGHDPVARTITLAAGDEGTEEFRLKSNTGMLTVISEPEGVSVFIDGAKVGETPASETKGLSLQYEIDGLADGKHILKFVKPGYFDKSGECEVKRGESTPLRVVLQRRFIPDYEVVTATGSHKGVLDSISGGVIRIETSPGVFKTYQVDDVISHGKLK